jgi:phospholipase/lecithinase/hemolysin
LIVDAFTQGQDQTAHPAQYGLTNVTVPACALSASVFNSLVCSTNTLIAGDVSHYQFADTVHPTPYGYQLLAQFVAKRMVEAGWL